MIWIKRKNVRPLEPFLIGLANDYEYRINTSTVYQDRHTVVVFHCGKLAGITATGKLSFIKQVCRIHAKTLEDKK